MSKERDEKLLPHVAVKILTCTKNNPQLGLPSGEENTFKKLLTY